MSKSPWGVGAWAAEAEREEEEEREQAAKAAAEAASIPPAQSQNFPSLKDAVGTAKQSKKKTKMTLQEFTMQSTYSAGLTPEEMLRLPTGPRERSSADEMPGRIGGGFSGYGARPSGPPQGRIRDSYGSEGTWGGSRRSYGGFEDEPRRGPQQTRGPRPDFEQTSRADEVDNWSTMKKPLPSFGPGPGAGPGPRPSRYASLGGGAGGPSRADEVDDWGSTKKTFPPPATRSYTFGSGMREPRPDSDRWTRDVNQERQTLSLEVPKGEDGGGIVKVNKPSPFGAARPREDVLAEKGLDWKKLDSDIEAKKVVSRPTSSQSSRPGSSQSNRSEGQALQGIGEALTKPKPKVNPFGEAKPREVLLEEKGLDWRKIDLNLDHKRVERPETDEEKKLKEEIEQLKNEMMQKSKEDQSSLHDLVFQKEKDLELLIRDLDDKVRFGQKAIERPGSGAGRFTGAADKTSQHGAFEEHRGREFMERPRSRGTGDAWSRPIEDSRPQRGRGRGYLGRDLDRSMSRDRW